jgi:Flp pilus assembly protein TadG
MRAKRIRKTLGNEKGQNLVEFALVVPLLLLLVIGIAEFGRAWMTKNLITGAAREAVRMYAVKNDTSAAGARADNILSSGGMDLSRRTITPGDTGVAVSYTITYDLPIVIAGFIPGLPSDNITLSSTTTMRKEY